MSVATGRSVHLPIYFWNMLFSLLISSQNYRQRTTLESELWGTLYFCITVSALGLTLALCFWILCVASEEQDFDYLRIWLNECAEEKLEECEDENWRAASPGKIWGDHPNYTNMHWLSEKTYTVMCTNICKYERSGCRKRSFCLCSYIFFKYVV